MNEHGRVEHLNLWVPEIQAWVLSCGSGRQQIQRPI